VAAYVVVFTAVLAAGHTPLTTAYQQLPAARGSNPLREAKAHALSLVPAGVPVSATNRLGGYLSNRRYISIFPSLGKAEWAVVDRNDPDYGIAGNSTAGLQRLQASPDWSVVYASHGLTVFRKRP
jgi:hypothetical protein